MGVRTCASSRSFQHFINFKLKKEAGSWQSLACLKPPAPRTQWKMKRAAPVKEIIHTKNIKLTQAHALGVMEGTVDAEENRVTD